MKTSIKFSPETMTSLAAKYDVSTTTFKKWLKPIESKLNRNHKLPFTPAQMEIIFDHLGEY